MAENELAPEPAAVDPAVAAAATPPAEPAPAEPIVGEPAPAPAPAAAEPAASPEPGKPQQSPWFMRRIAEESAKRRSIEDENANLKAMLDRMQREPAAPAAPGAPAAAPTASATVSPEQFRAEVAREAANINLHRDTVEVRNAGAAAFPNFGESLNTLTALGVTQDAIVRDLLAVDKANAHAILDKLAKDPERAATLVDMDPARRIAEFTRMSMAEGTKPAAAAPAPAAPAAPAVSRAPAPPPAPARAAAPANDWDSDDATPEQFMAGWKKKFLGAA